MVDQVGNWVKEFKDKLDASWDPSPELQPVSAYVVLTGSDWYKVNDLREWKQSPWWGLLTKKSISELLPSLHGEGWFRGASRADLLSPTQWKNSEPLLTQCNSSYS